jgi:divalent metal cation (Fe/Co/Zn/Cd) transporter
LIFGVGAGISFYEGITHIQHPHLIENPLWNYIVLGFAFLFDGISFIIALRNFNKHRGSQPFWASVKKSKDPTSFVVLFEDAADVLGLTVAFLGVYFGHLLKNPYFDGAASIIIGIILTGVSLVLTRESRSLLMGETAPPDVLKQVLVIVKSNPTVKNIQEHLSMVLSPDETLLVLRLNFKKDLSSMEITTAIQNMKREIQAAYPVIKQLYIEPVSGGLGGGPTN